MLVATLLIAGCGSQGAWTGEVGIGRTSSLGTGTRCGIEWDLRYRGVEQIRDIEVFVRFPRTMVPFLDGPSGQVTDWQPAAYPAHGPGSLRDAAELGRLSGNADLACRSDSYAALRAMRGAQLKILWTTPDGPRTQVVTVRTIKRGAELGQSKRRAS